MTFSETYNKVRDNFVQAQKKRKRVQAMQAITDPEKSAQKRIKRNLRRKILKKRRLSFDDPRKTKKQKTRLST